MQLFFFLLEVKTQRMELENNFLKGFLTEVTDLDHVFLGTVGQIFDGIYAGDNLNLLREGIYIVNGKKVVIK